MYEWTRDNAGWLFVIAGVLVIMLGGLRWPPGDGTATSAALAVALFVVGALVDKMIEPGRQARKRDRERAQRLGWAFGSKWPDAPDELVAWVATLNDAALADLHAWLSIFGNRPGIDDLRTTRFAPDEVRGTLLALTDDDRMALQEILERA